MTGHTIRELLAEIERLIAEVERLTEDNEEAKMIARAEAKLEDDEPDLMATSQAQRNLFKLLHREQLDAGR